MERDVRSESSPSVQVFFDASAKVLLVACIRLQRRFIWNWDFGADNGSEQRDIESEGHVLVSLAQCRI